MAEGQERPVFLNETEQRLVEHAQVIERAFTLQALEDLAVEFQSPEALVNRIRQATPGEMRRIGRAAADLFGMIDGLPLATVPKRQGIVAHPVEPTQPTPTPVAKPLEVEAPLATEAKPNHQTSGLPLRSHLLTQLTDEDPSGFIFTDPDRLIDKLLEVRKQQARVDSLDFRNLLTDLFSGASKREMAKRHDRSLTAIDQALRHFFKIVADRWPEQGASIVELLAAAPEPAAEPEPTPSSEEAPQAPPVKAAPRPAPPTQKLTVVETPQTSSTFYSPQQVLQLAIENPSVIGRKEWENAALDRLTDLMTTRQYSEEEIVALWERVHFGDSDLYKAGVEKRHMDTLKKVQTLMLGFGKRLQKDDKALQNVAVRTFLNMSRGVQTLDQVYEGLLKKEPKMTKFLAQRYLVDGIMELLYVE